MINPRNHLNPSGNAPAPQWQSEPSSSPPPPPAVTAPAAKRQRVSQGRPPPRPQGTGSTESDELVTRAIMRHPSRVVVTGRVLHRYPIIQHPAAIEARPDTEAFYRSASAPSALNSGDSRRLGGAQRSVAVQANVVENAIHEGGQLATQKRYPEALDALNAALALEPNNPYALHNFNLIQTKYNQHIADTRAAFITRERHAKAARDDFDAFFNEAHGLSQAGAHHQVLVRCTVAIEVQPNCDLAHVLKGQTLYSLNRLPEALEAYSAALRLNPSLAVAHLGQGNILFQQRKYEQAFTAYAQALWFDTTSADATSEDTISKFAGKGLINASAALRQASGLQVQLPESSGPGPR